MSSPPAPSTSSCRQEITNATQLSDKSEKPGGPVETLSVAKTSEEDSEGNNINGKKNDGSDEMEKSRGLSRKRSLEDDAEPCSDDECIGPIPSEQTEFTEAEQKNKKKKCILVLSCQFNIISLLFH
ncbi:unnamed protein product [Protopolystoma xenopodis]|uniref:Uncharacterized protein n=1 Tax=Protopolystoma xenopodis TaxID=117903 RepID=A0A448WII0_9PLAT|nr:unnamed protein product [Protopolystoma xenopodis]